jgi:hypothetical protein
MLRIEQAEGERMQAPSARPQTSRPRNLNWWRSRSTASTSTGTASRPAAEFRVTAQTMIAPSSSGRERSRVAPSIARLTPGSQARGSANSRSARWGIRHGSQRSTQAPSRRPARHSIRPSAANGSQNSNCVAMGSVNIGETDAGVNSAATADSIQLP